MRRRTCWLERSLSFPQLHQWVHLATFSFGCGILIALSLNSAWSLCCEATWAQITNSVINLEIPQNCLFKMVVSLQNLPFCLCSFTHLCNVALVASLHERVTVSAWPKPKWLARCVSATLFLLFKSFQVIWDGSYRGVCSCHSSTTLFLIRKPLYHKQVYCHGTFPVFENRPLMEHVS